MRAEPPAVLAPASAPSDDGGPRTATLFFICTAVWGTTWIAITQQLGTVDTGASVTWRFTLAALVLFAWTRARRAWRAPPVREFPVLVVIGALYATNYTLVYEAETSLPSGLVAVVGASILFFNIGLARVVIGTPVTRALAMGAALGVVGVTLVFKDELVAFDPAGRGRALLFALFGSFLASVANILAQRSAARGVDISSANVVWMAACAGFAALFVVGRGASFTFDPSPRYLASLVYLAVMGSVVTFSAYVRLLARVGAGPAGYVAVATPILALLVSSLVEDMRWPLTRVVGVALIALGQLLVVRRR